jgi:hypothetical protein
VLEKVSWDRMASGVGSLNRGEEYLGGRRGGCR